MAEIPKAPVKRIMKQMGASRVSDDAAEEMRDQIEEIIESRATSARNYAHHADRKTVHLEDVKEAFK